ncbi:EAL domain-containing protein [Thiomonas sp. X19]|uniref:EAL domain-containing protein n=1 Tax=Thiomonas sp. X19 TaxID=1050370 RepID=UPI000DD7A2DE|nr:EAL domain-containing protein [Thiomonas sp. X19]
MLITILWMINPLETQTRTRLQAHPSMERRASLRLIPRWTRLRVDGAVHFEQALRVGRVHEMVGVDLPSLLEAYHLYHLEIRRLLPASGLDVQQQECLGQAVLQRLMLDIEAQITSHYRVDVETAAAVVAIDKAIREAGNLSDLLHDAMEALSTLDGVRACLFARPDALGFLQIEAFGGEDGQQYAEALQSHHVPWIQTSADSAASQGPAGRAWRSAQIEVSETFGLDLTLRPWQAEGVRLGFRSSAAVPLLDEAGHAYAILGIYCRWPGFFSTTARRVLLQHVQQALSHAVLRWEQSMVIVSNSRQAYRQRIELGAIGMVYQPVIDMRHGRLQHVEALARLQGSDGQSIAPAAFLPALGKAGLLRLFQLGLDHVCQDVRMWRAQGLEFPVAINIPPEGLTQDVYRDSVFETLFRWGLPASALQLEILETQDPIDIRKRDARIAEFKRAGIRIVQDDLGSGYSSLLRMDHMAFDAVKIDQGLVRSALDRPMRALEFICHLTRLAHAFNIPVTVEGLENEGLIEAAAILGADHGQGYGIARPMPAQALGGWARDFCYGVDPQQPRTALGALAGYLLWDEQLVALVRWPELVKDFVCAPCLVQRYLTQCDAPQEALLELLARNHAHALQGTGSPGYIETRRQLTEVLSRVWLEAGHSPG